MRYEPKYTMEHNKERKVSTKRKKGNRNTEYCHKRKVVTKHELGI